MRNSAFKTMFKSISSDDYGRAPKCGETVSVNISETANSSITNFRLQTINLVLKNLISYSQYTLTDDSTANHKVLLTTRSNFKKDDDYSESDITVLCSVVRDMDKNNKKISHQSAEEYLKKRIDDMHLMALHKYGVRIKSDDKFLELKEKLGTAAGKLDMIEVKHSNPLTLSFDVKQAFILYNSARMETLLKCFEEKVASGYYQALPELDDIDMNLLTDNEEWALLKQLMLFPEVIKNSIGDLMNGKIGFHLLYKYLQNLAIAFSNYYSKKKVLTENRPQLMPILHAKIHLLKAIQAIFNKTLNIFDIEPVSFM
jgi:arginyl-tRNA synthetase